MNGKKIESKAKLVYEALQQVAFEQRMTYTLPGPHDDAEADLNDDSLLIAAREYVEAHKNENPIGG